MSAISLSLTIFGIMLVVMALRVPIAIAMFVAGTVGYIMQAGLDPYFSF
jgi:C4-dicarboxylate transporter DctM subunit